MMIKAFPSFLHVGVHFLDLPTYFIYLFIFIFCETEGQHNQRQMNKPKKTTRPHQGEAEPLGRETPPRKENQATDPTNQGQPPNPTEAGAKSLPTQSFPVPFNVQIVSPIKHNPSPPGLVEALKHPTM